MLEHHQRTPRRPLRTRLFERDGGRCTICRRAVKLQGPYLAKSADMATVGHIKPAAWGQSSRQIRIGAIMAGKKPPRGKTTPFQLQMIGEALYGPSFWRKCLAYDLRLHHRTIRRWRQSETTIPAWADRALARIIKGRVIRLTEVFDRLMPSPLSQEPEATPAIEAVPVGVSVSDY